MAKRTEKQGAFQLCVDIWLTEIHPDWTFGPEDGKKIKSIINKLYKSMKIAGHEDPSSQEIADAFRVFMQRLPEWFQDKELRVIDAHYNSILTRIKSGAGQKIDPNEDLHSFNEKFERIANGKS